MSEIKVSKIKGKPGVNGGKPNITSNITINGLSLDSAYGGSGQGTILNRAMLNSNTLPDSAEVERGNFWYNDSGTASLSMLIDPAAQQWVTLGTITSPAGAAWYGDRAVHAWGAYNSSGSPMFYWSLTTYGSASSFGTIPSGTKRHSTVSDATYGLFAGLSSDTDGIEYITISTPSNASAFGNLTQFREDAAGTCNGVRGCFGGGYESNYGSSGSATVIDYVTPATPGNATDFGDMSFSRFQSAGCADATRGIFGGGWNHAGSAQSNIIDYIEFDTPSNATDFGDLTLARRMFQACSDPTYGAFCGGSSAPSGNATNTIDYITIQTPGNATDFGDLYGGAIMYNGAVSNGTNGFAFGGYDNTFNSQSNISTFTFATPGNATLFGSMSVNNHSKGCSGNS